MKVLVAVLLIAAATPCAQAQTPSVPGVSKEDAQKVVAIIKGDKAKIKTYCNIKKLGRQMEQAYEKRDIKLTTELSHKIESLEKILGPEYVDLVDRLGAMDPENDIAVRAARQALCEVGLENWSKKPKAQAATRVPNDVLEQMELANEMGHLRDD